MSPTIVRNKALLRCEQSGGVVSMVESSMPAGSPGPRLHTHEFDEAFYVLDGELTIQIGDELITESAGGFAFAQRGTPHTVANLSQEPVHFLLLCTPAGFEREFGRRAAVEAGTDPPNWALKPIPEVIFVGPRIGQRDPSDNSPAGPPPDHAPRPATKGSARRST
jgi:quercetin dioxygenase-like cupin family protein